MAPCRTAASVIVTVDAALKLRRRSKEPVRVWHGRTRPQPGDGIAHLPCVTHFGYQDCRQHSAICRQTETDLRRPLPRRPASVSAIPGRRCRMWGIAAPATRGTPVFYALSEAVAKTAPTSRSCTRLDARRATHTREAVAAGVRLVTLISSAFSGNNGWI